MQNQAWLHAIYGAQAVHHLREYVNRESALDNNAYVISAIFEHGRMLSLYAAWAYKRHNGYSYRIRKLGTYLIDTRDRLKEGLTALKNGQDFVREKRKELVDLANGKAGSSRSAEAS